MSIQIKRLMSLLLAVIMLFSIPMTAFAASIEDGSTETEPDSTEPETVPESTDPENTESTESTESTDSTEGVESEQITALKAELQQKRDKE